MRQAGADGSGGEVGDGVAVGTGVGVGVSGMGAAVDVGDGVDAGAGVAVGASGTSVEVAASAMDSSDVGAACRSLSAGLPQANAKMSAAPISDWRTRKVVTSSCPLPAWVVGYSPQVAGLPGVNRKGAQSATLAGFTRNRASG